MECSEEEDSDASFKRFREEMRLKLKADAPYLLPTEIDFIAEYQWCELEDEESQRWYNFHEEDKSAVEVPSRWRPKEVDNQPQWSDDAIKQLEEYYASTKRRGQGQVEVEVLNYQDPEMHARLAEAGCEIIRMPRDGACLFLSVEASRATRKLNLYPEAQDADERAFLLRQDVYDHMLEREDEYVELYMMHCRYEATDIEGFVDVLTQVCEALRPPPGSNRAPPSDSNHTP